MTINDLLREAYFLATTPYNMQHPKFSSATSVYMVPTSNIKASCKIVSEAKSIVAVGGMGAIGFEMAINGAEKIDLFDINIFQKMFFELVKVAVIHFDYETFMKHFTLPYQSTNMSREAFKHFLSKEMYYTLRGYLPNDTKTIFDFLYNRFDSLALVMSSFYRYEFDMSMSYLKNFASLYNKKTYYELQTKLRENPDLITYETASITDIPRIYTDSYDAIILDNMLQYHKDFEGLETAAKVDEFVKNDLHNMLNPGGVVEVNYGYELRTAALKRKLNMPYNKKVLVSDHRDLPPHMLSMYSDILTEKEMREGLNTNLIDYEGYEYHFIPGVETEHKAQNSILTYTRHR